MARKKSISHERQRQSARATLLEALFRPVDSASVIVLRVLFGLLMAVLVAKLFVTGDLQRLYLAQTIRIKFPLFGWLPDPSAVVFQIVFVIVGVSAFFFAIGFLYRWASVAFFLSWSYVFFVDQTPYQNHDYLACLLGFLFMLMPLNGRFSVDARLRPAMRAETVPAWCLHILRFQIAVVYVFGGIRKLNPDWLRGEPIRTMLHTKAFEHPVIGQWFFDERLVTAFAWGGLLLDLAIVPALLWRRTRLPAFIIALLFHLMNAVLWDIDVFPWFMIGATLLFFPPDYPRRLAAMLRRREYPARPPDATPQRAYTPAQKTLAAVLAVYAAIQILVPLRPFLYPGHPLEQPDLLLFSWNMMLRLNTTQARFVVVDNGTGERAEVVPQEILSEFQMGSLGSPNTVHQVARHLARDQRRKSGVSVSVFALVRQSVHGRPWQLAVNPTVDLAAIPPTLGVKSWVLPFNDRVPTDPSARTAFNRAEWAFCKQEGILPLGKHGADPETLAKVRAWEDAHRDLPEFVAHQEAPK